VAKVTKGAGVVGLMRKEIELEPRLKISNNTIFDEWMRKNFSQRKLQH
jgi:hypothetical protein